MLIALCDDDPVILNQIKTYIEEFFQNDETDYEIICFHSGEELISSDLHIDIAFIDIEMSKINGLKTAGWIQKKNQNAIILMVTSYNEYLDDAMEINVYRYLSKPIDKKRFMLSLSSAVKRHFNICQPVVLELDDGTSKINTADILWLSIENRYITVHTAIRSYETKKTMDWWKNQLNPLLFAQPHKSYLVNLNYVNNFDKTTVSLKSNGKIYKVYCSRRKYADFKKSFYTYLKHTGIRREEQEICSTSALR